jgi:protein phosphatase
VTQGLRVAGDTNVGKVRTTNEDAMIVDHTSGLYVVFDGMGGANAGDVASQTARDALRDFVTRNRDRHEPKALLEAGIQHACRAVWSAAKASRAHNGMGTTVVACLVVDLEHAIVAHVGDSRAYMLRSGRLQLLTRDHTVVEDLVARGRLAAEEAERHPHKNVLSRNLGALRETRIDVLELELQPGDRLLLCSDGLYGFASAESIQYLLGSGDAPEHVARDLIDVALRGGGGDNVSTIVIETPAAAATSTQVVRTTGAMAWWQRRQRFLQVASDRGITQNPICRSLKPEEALDLVALSLCQAVFHDLEKSTGVNVWTFMQNLAGPWFERGGEWGALRDLVDILSTSSRTVIDEIRAGDENLGYLLDIAVSRALVVGELALGGLLAERLRQVEGALIHAHAAFQPASEPVEDTSARFIDQPTVPFLRPDRTVTNAGVSGDVLAAIGKALTIARARTAPRGELVKQILNALDTIATDSSGQFASAVSAARELYGVGRSVDEAGIMPLFDAMDSARVIIASSVHQVSAPDALRAKVLSAVSIAHQRLVSAITALVLEAVEPLSGRLRDARAETAQLRKQVVHAERERAVLEKKLADTFDQSLPWDNRGSTEW